jgi:hypothetical protein
MKELADKPREQILALALAAIVVLSAATISWAQEARCYEVYDGSGVLMGPYCQIDLPR